MSADALGPVVRAAQFIADAFAAVLPFVASNDGAAEPIRQLARQLGWELPGPVPPSLVALRSTFVALGQSSARAAALAEQARSGKEPSAEEATVVLAELAAAIGLGVAELARLGDSLKSELPASFVNTTQIDQKFATRLLDTLIIGAALRNSPGIVHVFRLAGIVEISEQQPDQAASQPAFTLHCLRWDRISKLLSDPGALLADTYGWGTPQLKMTPVFEALSALKGGHGRYDYPSPGLVRAIAPTIDPRKAAADIERSYQFRIIDTGILNLDAALTAIPKASPGEPQGIALALVLSGGAAKLEIPLTHALSLVIGGSLDGSTGIAVALRPGQDPSIVSDFDGTRSPVTGAELSVGLAYKAPSETEGLEVFSLPIGAKLEVFAGSASATLAVSEGTPPDVGFKIAVERGRFTLGGGQGDGFLTTLLPEGGFHSDFEIVVGASYARGLYFEGSATLEIKLPLHVSLGPIDLQSMYVVAGIRDGTVPLELSTTIGAKLGPLAAVVERIGATVKVEFPGAGGNLGPANLSFGFKPPNGVGLSIDASVVKGGGYLYFDFDKEEYAGAMELAIASICTVTAIGLVTTRMPDGGKGFSLLVIITAEFGTGIQLGFGFTLVGVGGLLGLNRTVKLQVLAEGVRTGAVNEIMFPRDVVANAPKIISDLKAIFPVFEDKFLIGPLAKIGWGSPPLITLSLGVIIEIPGNLAILGVLRCILPDEKAPVLTLQVAFVGAIEFDKQRLWLFAGIFDSKILTFAIEGELGVLFAWGDHPDFVLSVGGFHPQFKPPPLPFPSPKRLAISILDRSDARIRVSSYFAVTTNTVQFGAAAELFFGFDAIAVEGSFHFDALFQFSPFYFIIELGASVSLSVFGCGVFSISLDLALEGPTPWHAKGRGTLSLFFFDVSADFDVTWGEEKDTTLPPVEVFPLLAAELEKQTCWSALPPRSANLLVSLRVAGEEEFVLHPVGTLRVTQRTIPLGSTIDLFGAQRPSDATRFALDVKTDGLARTDVVKEQFAPAQFHAMSRAEKLSAPAYAEEDGGIDVSATGDALRSSLVARRVVRYEQTVVDTGYRRLRQRFTRLAGSLFRHFMGGNAAARSPLSARRKRQLQPFAEVIKTSREGFAVASAATNERVPGTARFGSYHAAKEHLEQAVARDPALAGTMHVVPEFEVARKAA